MDELLLLLAKKGALRAPVRLTTTELGRTLGMSQQNASVRLRALVHAGLAERSGGQARISKKGEAVLRKAYAQLREALESRHIILRGKVARGLGEGGHYMSLPGYRRRMEKKLGFLPYAGTLNLELLPDFIEKRVELRSRRPIRISGFVRNGRSYGPIDAYRCRIGSIDGAVIFPRRSQHGLSIIEVIAPVFLMGELRLKYGSMLEVEALP
ncbi:MAG: DUF120 domain-containing protein [Candidatus Micrarchaeota archaeon]